MFDTSELREDYLRRHRPNNQMPQEQPPATLPNQQERVDGTNESDHRMVMLQKQYLSQPTETPTINQPKTKTSIKPFASRFMML